jgi:hypothetical protein
MVSVFRLWLYGYMLIGVSSTDSKLAHCVTLTNPFEHQHGIYCDSIGTTITTAYENFIITGSIAAQPSTQSSTSSTPSSTTNSATTSSGALVATTASPASPQAHGHASLSGGSLAGIAVGSVAAGAALIALVVFLILRRRKNPDRQRGNYAAPPAFSADPGSNYGTPAEKAYDPPQRQTGPLEMEGSPGIIARPSFGNSPARSIAESDNIHHAIPLSTLQKDMLPGTPGQNNRESAYKPYRPESELSGLTTSASVSAKTSPRASPTLRDGFLRSPPSSPPLGSTLHGQNNTPRSGTFEPPETIHEAPGNAAVPDFGRNRDRSVSREDDARGSSRRRTSGWLSPETAMLEGYRDD